MQQALQFVAVAVLAVILSKVMQTGAFDVVLILAVCAAAAAVLVEVLQPLVSFAQELQERIAVEDSLLSTLWKVLGITLVCRIGASICADAGQKALSELVQRGGELLSLCAAIPLMRAVLMVLETLTGGWS